MSEGLLACPFCRQLFTPGEAERCPECALALKPLASLPPSYEALADEPLVEIAPEDERRPFTDFSLGRGALAALAALGVTLFFTPWIVERAPEIAVRSGFDLAARQSFWWAAAIAFFVMIPLVLSRRTIRAMRGARVAVAFLAAMVLVTVIVRMAFGPSSGPYRPVRYDWGWGLYATGALALLILSISPRFGGKPISGGARAAKPPSHKPRAAGKPIA